MEGKFDQSKLEGIKEQAGPIHDPEKAEEMATIEKEGRQLAYLYRKYLEVPEAEADAAIGAIRDDELPENFRRGDLRQFFPNMRASGVAPEYLERIAEIEAEVAGAMRDWREEVGNMSDEQLENAWQGAWEGKPRNTAGNVSWDVPESMRTLSRQKSATLNNSSLERLIPFAKMEILAEERRARADQNPFIKKLRAWGVVFGSMKQK